MPDSNFQDAYIAGQAASHVRDPRLQVESSDQPFIVVPVGHRLESVEPLLAKPLARRTTVSLQTAESFGRFVAEFVTAATRLFAAPSAEGGKFVAIIDYHGTKEEEASWCAFKVQLQCQFSLQWKLWSGSNNKFMPQREFAEFLESNSAQIMDPPSAEFLEVAQNLQVSAGVAITGVTRLDDGRDQINYEAVTVAKAGEKGNLAIPSMFILALPVFEGTTAWKIKARLRTRVTDQKKLELKYELVNPQNTLREAWEEQINIIKEATKLNPYIGAP
jgi:uncharacterized protein YfdQ (DUF2303 family)